MPINWEQLAKTDEFFAWTSTDTGEVLHFAVTRINTYLAGTEFPTSRIDLDPDFVRAVALQNGIELDYLPRLSPGRLNMPVTLLAWPDGTHVVADGSHRIVARFTAFLFWADAWMVPERVWRRFVITGVPGADVEWRAHLQDSNPGMKP